MKNTLKNIFAKNRFFLTSLILFFLGAFITWQFAGSTFIFINANASHSFWKNVFFINYSFLGNGIFALSLTLFLFFYLKKKQTGKLIFAAFGLSFITIQLLKNIFAFGPLTFFTEPLQHLFYTDAADWKTTFISPSSYTATAFSLAVILGLRLRSGWYQLSLLAAAFLVGYSRIYLVQNSVADILIGAVTGSICGILVYTITASKVTITKGLKELHNFNNGSKLGSEIQPV